VEKQRTTFVEPRLPRALPAATMKAMDARERAEWRRRHWVGGVASGHDEMAEVDLAFWLSVPPEERLAAVFEMWDEQMSLKDPSHEASARLQRSVGGVRPRRG
jgi:hypothetical protein